MPSQTNEQALEAAVTGRIDVRDTSFISQS